MSFSSKHILETETESENEATSEEEISYASRSKASLRKRGFEESIQIISAKFSDEKKRSSATAEYQKQFSYVSDDSKNVELLKEQAAQLLKLKSELRIALDTIKILREFVRFQRFFELKIDVMRTVLSFLHVREVGALDIASTNRANRCILNSAFKNLNSPAFDQHRYKSFQALEWILKKSIHLDFVQCNFRLPLGHSVLSLAVSQGRYDIADLLIISGDQDINEMIEYQTSSGRMQWTCLHLIASQNDSEGLNYLLKSTNCNLEVTDSRGWSALHWAVFKDAYDACLTLLGAGINTEVVPERPPSRTPLLFACQIGSSRILKALIDAGANVSHCDENSNSALLICVQFKTATCAQILLDNDAVKANIRNTQGWSPLKLAMNFEDDAMSLMLLESKKTLI